MLRHTTVPARREVVTLDHRAATFLTHLQNIKKRLRVAISVIRRIVCCP